MSSVQLKTNQNAIYESDSDVILFEVIRVQECVKDLGNGWAKNTIPINFSTRNITLFGSRKYHVIGTCHHTGSLTHGHWYLKMCLSDGQWWELNDLKAKHTKSTCPGVRDATVVVLLCVATDKLRQLAF